MKNLKQLEEEAIRANSEYTEQASKKNYKNALKKRKTYANKLKELND